MESSFVTIIIKFTIMETKQFEKGTLFMNGENINIENLPWNEHPTFKGVFLKHVIKGKSTNNQLSCHLVKINPDCEIGLHNHAGKTELHEIIDGFGECVIEQDKLNYQKGTTGFIPADKNHLVKAGNQGLFILAKFFPALL